MNVPWIENETLVQCPEMPNNNTPRGHHCHRRCGIAHVEWQAIQFLPASRRETLHEVVTNSTTNKFRHIHCKTPFSFFFQFRQNLFQYNKLIQTN